MVSVTCSLARLAGVPKSASGMMKVLHLRPLSLAERICDQRVCMAVAKPVFGFQPVDDFHVFMLALPSIRPSNGQPAGHSSFRSTGSTRRGP